MKFGVNRFMRDSVIISACRAGGGCNRAVDRAPPVTHFRRPWPCRRHSRRVLPPPCPQRGGGSHTPGKPNLQMARLFWLHTWFGRWDLFIWELCLLTWNFRNGAARVTDFHCNKKLLRMFLYVCSFAANDRFSNCFHLSFEQIKF